MMTEGRFLSRWIKSRTTLMWLVSNSSPQYLFGTQTFMWRKWINSSSNKSVSKCAVWLWMFWCNYRQWHLRPFHLLSWNVISISAGFDGRHFIDNHVTQTVGQVLDNRQMMTFKKSWMRLKNLLKREIQVLKLSQLPSAPRNMGSGTCGTNWRPATPSNWNLWPV